MTSKKNFISDIAVFALINTIALLPFTQSISAINPIYLLFFAALALDILLTHSVILIIILCCAKFLIFYSFLGLLGMTLCFVRCNFLKNKSLIGASLLLIFGKYLNGYEFHQAIISCGVITYAVYVLYKLPKNLSFSTDFQFPLMLQFSAYFFILALSMGEGWENESARFFISINSNVDSIFITLWLNAIGGTFLALALLLFQFRSRSGILTFITQKITANVSYIHMFIALLAPFFLFAIMPLLPRLEGKSDSMARIFSINDDSNAYRLESISKWLDWIAEYPNFLLGTSDASRSEYLFFNNIFPHNFLVYSSLNDGVFVTISYLWFVMLFFNKFNSGGKIAIISAFIGLGFSDLGFSYEFVIALISVSIMNDWRTNSAKRFVN